MPNWDHDGGLRDAAHAARRALRGEQDKGPWCAFCGGRFGHDESACPDNDRPADADEATHRTKES